MLQHRSISAASAILIATVVFSATRAAGAARGLAGPKHGEPRTVAITSEPLTWLAADGPLLVWPTYTGEARVYHFFNPAARREASRLRLGEVNENCGATVFAGRRALFACERFSNLVYGFSLSTAAVGDRLRQLGEFNLHRDGPRLTQRAGAIFAPASDGRTIIYFGAGNRSDSCTRCWRQGVWRLAGRRPVRVPNQHDLLAGVAVAGRKLATLGWESPCSCDVGPEWSPDGREIAWVHAKSTWLVDSDGHNARRLSTARAGSAQSPRWSPTRAMLAFQGEQSVWLIDRDGSNEHKLVDGARPTWSPDGTRLAFVRGNDLWTINADGTGEKRLTTDGLSGAPDWSPDGKTLAVARGEIYLVDAMTGMERKLTCCNHGFEDAAWSPDGSRVAMGWSFSSSYEDEGIWVVRADGGGLARISSGDFASGDFAGGARPAWSLDSRRIAYERWPVGIGDETSETWIVNVDGTDDRKLRSNDCPVEPAWSPDGRRIAAGESEYCEEAGIWSIDPNGGASKLLAAPWNPPAVEVRNLLTGKLLRRWHLPIRNTSGDSVAYSGRYLLVRERRVTVRTTHWVLHRYDAASGKALGVLPLPRSAGVLSLRGRWAVYRFGRQIAILDVKSGRRSTLSVPTRDLVGPVIEGNHVFWAEPFRKGSRVREVVLR